MAAIPVIIQIPEKLWADYCILLENCPCGMRSAEEHLVAYIKTIVLNNIIDDLILEAIDATVPYNKDINEMLPSLHERLQDRKKDYED